MKALLGCVTEVYNNYKDRISQPNKSGSFGRRGTGMGAGEAPLPPWGSMVASSGKNIIHNAKYGIPVHSWLRKWTAAELKWQIIFPASKQLVVF